DGEGKNGDEGEDGGAAEHAQGIAEIAEAGGEPQPSPGVAAALAQEKVVAKAGGRGAVAGEHFLMKPHFLGELAPAAGMQQMAKAAEEAHGITPGEARRGGRCGRRGGRAGSRRARPRRP